MIEVEQVDFVAQPARLRRAAAARPPQRWQPSVTGVCKQTWFTDPDGNSLMLHRRFDV